tara:strand:- start:692 stop:961 length:270 start_codon:yes stop_codon:yes gene_type:complete
MTDKPTPSPYEMVRNNGRKEMLNYIKEKFEECLITDSAFLDRYLTAGHVGFERKRHRENPVNIKYAILEIVRDIITGRVKIGDVNEHKS